MEIYDEKDKPIAHVFPEVFNFINDSIVPDGVSESVYVEEFKTAVDEAEIVSNLTLHLNFSNLTTSAQYNDEE